jgi:hypothetical protein
MSRVPSGSVTYSAVLPAAHAPVATIAPRHIHFEAVEARDGFAEAVFLLPAPVAPAVDVSVAVIDAATAAEEVSGTVFDADNTGPDAAGDAAVDAGGACGECGIAHSMRTAARPWPGLPVAITAGRRKRTSATDMPDNSDASRKVRGC